MWMFYIALVVIAGVSFALGVIPLGIIAVIVLALAAGYAAVNRGRTAHLETRDAPSGIPNSREAAVETQVDPTRTPAGGSTGTL
jgi:hypothetical protein